MQTKPLLIILVAFIGLVSCSWTQAPRPNVVIIAADSLPSSELNCTDDSGLAPSAFNTLCQESVRFTHAFTTSVLSAPAMATLLTGQYPLEHGLRHNGNNALPAKENTLAEKALEQGYRTSFYSGGAPIFRKLGIDQGFELFEDNITPKRTSLFRPLEENIDFFKRWFEEASEQPFLATFYVPDLLFSFTETFDNLGEARTRSYPSQLEELDESAESLVNYLKKAKVWENTIFVFVGLNGQTGSLHRDQLGPTNLYSDNSQVALLVKPVRKVRDLGLKWKIDRNVSLVDVAHTLAEAMGITLNKPSAGLKKVSLLNALQGEDPEWDDERLIVTESAWANWHGVGPIRWAARKGQWMYLHNENPLVFNTLIDRMELVPSSMQDPVVKDLAFEMMNFFGQFQMLQWQPMPTGLIDKFYIASQKWLPNYTESSTLQNIKLLYKQGFQDRQLLDWWASMSLANNDWKSLKIAAQKGGEVDWLAVANAHLKNEEPDFTDPCLSTLDADLDEAEVLRICDDRMFLQLRDWIISSSGSEEKEKARELFLRNYRLKLLERRIYELNLAFGALWDIPLSKPGPPDRVTLTLALPAYKRYQRITNLRLE